jgi:hypothetical protein
MTLLRPMSVAALLALTPALAVAADASPRPPPYLPPQAAEGVNRNPPPRAGEGKEGGAALPSPLAAQSLDLLSATRKRPLFSPTRRPPAPPAPIVNAPEAPPPPPPPPDVALFGIVMDGDEARAVVRTGPAQKIMRVRIGDDIGGWKVSQIEGRRLVLSRDDRIATFMMFTGNGTAGAPPTSPQAPSADGQSQTQTQNEMRQIVPAPADPQASGGRKPHRPR